MKTETKTLTLNFFMTVTLVAAVLMMFVFNWNATVNGWNSEVAVAAFWGTWAFVLSSFLVWVYYKNMPLPAE